MKTKRILATGVFVLTLVGCSDFPTSPQMDDPFSVVGSGSNQNGSGANQNGSGGNQNGSGGNQNGSGGNQNGSGGNENG